MDEDFRKRLRKTLYCGDLEPEDASLALTDLTVEYFQGLAPHKLGYVDLHSASNITSHDTVSTSSVAMGMIYAKRLQRKRPDYVRKMSSSDLFLISMMMASKYLYDEGVDEEVFNDEWAENADLEKEEVNCMERDFLDAMDWELFIKRDEFNQTMLSIERGIALREGLKRGWFSYTDLCLLWDDPRLEFWVSDVGLEWLKVVMVSSAAYFAAAMTMVGSTVLVTSASLMLASSGVPSVQLPGLQPIEIPLHGLPSLPALEYPSHSSSAYGQNETANVDTQPALQVQPEAVNPESAWAPCKTVVETIMSQLMAVLTLKSHLVQFVSAVADNYTSTRFRSTKKGHSPVLGCSSKIGTSATQEPEVTPSTDVYSYLLEMEKLQEVCDADGCLEVCPHCGRVPAGSDGIRSLPFKLSWGCSHLSHRAHSKQRGAWYLASDIRNGLSCGHCKGQQHGVSSVAGGCPENVAGIDGWHLFPDITIGFTTSMLPPVYAT